MKEKSHNKLISVFKSKCNKTEPLTESIRSNNVFEKAIMTAIENNVKYNYETEIKSYHVILLKEYGLKTEYQINVVLADGTKGNTKFTLMISGVENNYD